MTNLSEYIGFAAMVLGSGLLFRFGVEYLNYLDERERYNSLGLCEKHKFPSFYEFIKDGFQD